MTRHVVISAFATVFATTVIVVAYASRSGERISDFFHFDGASEQGAGWSWRPFFYVVAMLFGILCGYLHSRLAHRKRVNLLLEVKRAIRAGAFTRSLLVSPIVFGAVYALTKNQPDMLVGTLVAFENGFFCDVIFRRRENVIVDPQSSDGEEPNPSVP